MSEPIKPATKEEFARLLLHTIHSREYVGPEGAQKSAAQEARVSPSAISLMCAGAFPQKLANELSRTRVKRDEGAIFSLARVCDTFGFDFETCRCLFELPDLPHVAEKSRSKRVPMIDLADLEMLKKHVEMIGPVSLELLATLVTRFHNEKRKKNL